MSNTELQFSNVRKRPLIQRIRETIYEPESGSVFGRTGASWVKIAVFYIIFYGCLASFFVVSMLLFYRTLNDDAPKLVGKDIPIKMNPGMGFRPQPSVDTNYIRFQQGVETSYKKYTDDITNFLKAYAVQNQTSGNYQNCSDGNEIDPKKACTFDVSQITTKCAPPNYGYNEGQPCVLLKLNKVFGWTPTQNDSSEEPSNIRITCGGLHASDDKFINDVEIYPSDGLPSYYFPYNNQEKYLSPLVFARFPKVVPEEDMSIWCKAWASNIMHHRHDKAGSVVFELRVD